MQGVRDRSIDCGAANAVLLEMYLHLPQAYASYYANLLDLLSRPDAFPALVHCTSGKDRTGFAIAVVLMALGVSREVIVEDYILTNQYRRDLSFMLGKGVDPEVLKVVTSARPEFLQAAFAVIDGIWGDDQRFIREGLGLSAEKQEVLKERLLSDPVQSVVSGVQS